MTVTPVPSDDDVQDSLKTWREQRFDESRAKSLAAHFNRWLEQYTSRNYRERAKKGAAKRWKKGETPLDSSNPSSGLNQV